MRKMTISIALTACVFLGLFFVLRSMIKDHPVAAIEESADLRETSTENAEAESNRVIILKVAHNLPESHPRHIALTQKFVPLIESGSNWTIRVEIYPNQQLGNESAYVDGLRKGTVEMCIGGQSIAGLLPNIGMLELPYLFQSYEHFGAFMNSREGSVITKGLDELGIRKLGWTHNGFRQISLTSVYLKGDTRLMRLGTNGSASSRSGLEIMGFEPKKIDMQQLSVAINQSLVEGHDFPLITAYYNGWTDNLAYLLRTDHVLATDMYLVNEKFWSGLTSKQRDLISKVVAETVAYESELISNAEAEILHTLAEEKIPIVPYDSQQIRERIHENNMVWIGDNMVLKALYEQIKTHKPEE